MIDLVISGTLPVGAEDADGQIDLPREPPFPPVVVPTPAAVVTVSLYVDGGNFLALDRLFHAWYRHGGTLHVCAGDGQGRWIGGRMQCRAMTVHEGIQSTRSVLPPVKWRTDAWGRRLPYRDQATFQRISKGVREYVLTAERYEFRAAPAKPEIPAQMVLN